MNNVFVVGALYSDNLGDDVLLETVANVCHEACGVEPVLLSISGLSAKINNNGGERANKRCRTFLKKTSIYQELIEYKRCFRLRKKINNMIFDDMDIIIFGGGQMFMDIFAPLINIIIEEAEKRKIKIIFNACGMGPLSSRNQKSLFKHLSSPVVSSITLRDGVDKFKDLYKGNLDVYKVLDPAIECSSYFPRSECREKKMGLGLISPVVLKKHGIDIDERLLLAVARIVVKICNKRNICCEIFCNGDYDDYITASKISDEIHADNCTLSARPTDSRQLIELISKFDYIVSFRLHSHIIAASYRIPSFGLIWDKKVEEFFNCVGRKQWIYKVESGMDMNTMERKIEAFLDAQYELDLNKVPSSCETLRHMLSK